MAKTDKLQGTLDLLVLRTLRRETLHGFGVAARLEDWSDGALLVEEGSLYPALHRLERDGLLRAAWKRTENGRRAKYYSLTRAGRRRLDEELENWNRLSAAVRLVLKRSAT